MAADKALTVLRERYLAKGSPKPVKDRCGARLRRPPLLDPPPPFRYCTQQRLHGRRRCRLHGGKSLTGVAHPRFGTGQETAKRLNPFATGSALARGYEAEQTDPDFQTLKEQIRLLDARQYELVERIANGSGESASAWWRAREAAKAIDAAMRINPATTESVLMLTTAVADLLTVTRGSVAREEAHQEMRAIAKLRARLLDTQAKLLERLRATMTVDQFLALANAIAALVSRCISIAAKQNEHDALREWAAGIKALTGGMDPSRQLTAGGAR